MQVRVLVVSNMYPGPRTPYYGAFVEAHVTRLARDPRFRVRVVAIDDARKGKLRSALKYGTMFARILREVSRFKPHVVHYHYALPTAILGPLLEMTRGIRYAVTLHGGDFWEMPQRIPYGPTLLRHVLGHASHIITVSDALARGVVDFLHEEPARLSTINMGVDTKRFALAKPASATRLLLVGQWIHRKGGDLAIRALADARRAKPELTLSFVGAGPEQQAWQALADELGVADAVRFLGVVEPEAVARVMAEHGVLLVPSRREPLGLVALEGMAVGLTVIASRTGGLAELVQDRDNGILVPPDDVGALAQAILLVQTATSTQRTAIRERARRTAEMHDTGAKVAAVAEILLRIGRGTGLDE